MNSLKEVSENLLKKRQELMVYEKANTRFFIKCIYFLFSYLLLLTCTIIIMPSLMDIYFNKVNMFIVFNMIIFSSSCVLVGICFLKQGSHLESLQKEIKYLEEEKDEIKLKTNN